MNPLHNLAEAFRACRRPAWMLCALLLLTLGRALAHEGKGHGGDPHGEAMRRLQERIPEEYLKMKELPEPPTRQSLAAGKKLYLDHCASCHGKTGRGDGAAGKGMKPRPANFLDLKHSASYSPGAKYWIITEGAPELGMPGYRETLTDNERWELVQYILSLQEKGKGRPRSRAN